MKVSVRVNGYLGLGFIGLRDLKLTSTPCSINRANLFRCYFIRQGPKTGPKTLHPVCKTYTLYIYTHICIYIYMHVDLYTLRMQKYDKEIRILNIVYG